MASTNFRYQSSRSTKVSFASNLQVARLPTFGENFLAEDTILWLIMLNLTDLLGDKIKNTGRTKLTIRSIGEVAERPNAPVLKTGVGQLTGGSNPPLSALSFLRSNAPSCELGESCVLWNCPFSVQIDAD